MYSNESERSKKDIYDDFKLKKPFGFHGVYANNSALCGLKRSGPASPVHLSGNHVNRNGKKYLGVNH